jgi:poly(hydroxyalkanoate) depolymerase family esterase
VKTTRYRDIITATKLTRAGNLKAATALLQASLTGKSASTDSVAGVASPEETTPGQVIARAYRNEAGARNYKLFVPSGYNGQACPLIVMMHGCTQSPDDFAAGTRMNELAEEGTFLVAYPEQPASANPRKCWNWFKPEEQQRNLGEPSIVAGITRQIVDEYAIDRSRVYVAGMSAGAAAAAVLGATYPDIYAAVGVHSGLVRGLAHDVNSAFAVMKNGGSAARSRTHTNRRENDRPIATIVFHGDRDRTVNKANSDRFADGLSTPAYTERVATGRSPGGRSYTKTIYADRSGRSVLEQWSIHGVGHAWSGGSVAGSYTDPLGPDASREMVRFFLSHQLV